MGNKNDGVPTEVGMCMWCFFYVVCGFIVCIVETDRGMFKVHIYKTESPLLVQS